MYRSRVVCFVEWCTTRGLCAIPAHADVLRVHLQWLAASGQTWSTIKVSLAAVAAIHRALGHEPPASGSLRAAVRELRRAPPSHGPAERIPPATLKRIVATCASGQLGTRDRALLLVAYFGNLTSGEATSLNGADVERSSDGYILHVPVKLLGRKRTIELVELRRHEDLELCPVHALDAWLSKRVQFPCSPPLTARQGPLFVVLHGARFKAPRRLSAKSFTRVLEGRASAAGIAQGKVSVHGLRAGAFVCNSPRR